MTGIDVEDNAVVNHVVEVIYEVVAHKTGRSSTLNGLTMPLHCTHQCPTGPHRGSTLLVPFHTNYYHMDAIKRTKLIFHTSNPIACGKGTKTRGIGAHKLSL